MTKESKYAVSSKTRTRQEAGSRAAAVSRSLFPGTSRAGQPSAVITIISRKRLQLLDVCLSLCQKLVELDRTDRSLILKSQGRGERDVLIELKQRKPVSLGSDHPCEHLAGTPSFWTPALAGTAKRQQGHGQRHGHFLIAIIVTLRRYYSARSTDD
jgi:hypothetical protein